MPEAFPTQEHLLEVALQDAPTVTPAGVRCAKVPEDVRIRELVVHTDERGTICELLDPRWGWGWGDAPLVYAYFFTIRPGWAKGWAMHKGHEDRYCILSGEMKVVLYDARPDSSTLGLVSEIYMTEQRRAVVSIPPGVWHADENVGTGDALGVNFPTRPYEHEHPDKYCLPLHNDLIPYRFKHAKGC